MLNKDDFNTAPPSELVDFRWSVDHFAISEEGALLIFGWAVHDKQSIVGLRALLKFHDGSKQQVQVVYGTERLDLVEAIPDNPRARDSGYYLFGQVTRTDVVSLSLEAYLADGIRVVLPTHSTIPAAKRGSLATHRRSSTVMYKHLAVRAAQFIRSGRFRDLAASTRRYLAGRPQGSENGIDHARWLSTQADAMELIVDHSLGGGANQFRHTLTDKLVADGRTVLVLSFRVPTLQFVLECRHGNESKRLGVRLDEFLQALPHLKLRRVHFNNAVSFTRQLPLLEALRALARRYRVPISYYLHDYHSICPSHFLLDKRGEYCGVPDIDRCQQCLPEMKDGLVSLFVERDIGLWRRRWGAFLAEVDEIVYFSQASRDLLLRAHPKLARHPGFTYRPHDLGDFPAKPVPVDIHAPLNIGVVGRINVHKGSRIVQEMAVEIDRRRADAQVTVLGALDGGQNSHSITVTGSYERAELANMLAARKVNVVAFTSIWPETFSFVISEIMSLGLPIVCFDLGAPAERVKKYRLGRVVPLSNGSAILDAAIALRDDLIQESTKAHAPVSAGQGKRVASAGIPNVSRTTQRSATLLRRMMGYEKSPVGLTPGD